MSRIFITGSTEGIGRAAASSLLSQGHQVVLHARSRARASALNDLATEAAGIVIGDLRSAAETRPIGLARRDTTQEIVRTETRSVISAKRTDAVAAPPGTRRDVARSSQACAGGTACDISFELSKMPSRGSTEYLSGGKK